MSTLWKNYGKRGGFMPDRGVIAVEKAPGRSVPDRDLRTLSTDELIALIRSDIKELDGIIAAERRAARGHEEKKTARHKSAREAVDDVLPEEEERVEMHSVTCCNHHMGDFPPWARVRCPFCNEWHRAGDFPNAS